MVFAVANKISPSPYGREREMIVQTRRPVVSWISGGFLQRKISLSRIQGKRGKVRID